MSATQIDGVKVYSLQLLFSKYILHDDRVKFIESMSIPHEFNIEGKRDIIAWFYSTGILNCQTHHPEERVRWLTDHQLRIAAHAVGIERPLFNLTVK